MAKQKLTNKEKLEIFFSIAILIILILIIATVPRPKSPIEKWHDAIDEGKSWNEYMEEVNLDD